MKNGELKSSLVGDHPDMVQMLLHVVQASLGVAEVAAKGGVRGSLVGKAISVDPPIVLVAGTK
jgi:DNA-binding phage protein